ncbi:hypothetical protein NEF87_001599 [Candidatus Lokiarchaeum ossiferum]|uniref:Right handed beta helix domain-containing protein n=1 Tax=Candidatus Lokiarchaeum ossiferum TaxID=2951803 RepID=A0ABY6HS67_9ARCH|nr:hypothetical protein NEF87_001599 [Candidatus Lokiarchaeum sp. B-35]
MIKNHLHWFNTTKKYHSVLFFGFFCIGLMYCSFPLVPARPSLPSISVLDNSLSESLILPLTLVGTHEKVYIDPLIEGQDWKDCPYVTGRGTRLSPYLFENLIIDAGGEGCAFRIENSDEHVVFRNCTGFNAGTRESKSAFTLYRCSNVKFENCIAANSFVGMFSKECDEIEVIECLITNNSEVGIYTFMDDYNRYVGNKITYNGQIGLDLDVSKYAEAYYNIIENNPQMGCSIMFSSYCDVYNNIIRFNLETGVELYAGQNYNNTVRNNIIVNNSIGVKVLRNTRNNMIYGNIIANNSFYEAFDDTPGYNLWDDGTSGNYWGNYSQRYPDATNDGEFWSIPYSIYKGGSLKTEMDYFPLASMPEIDFVAHYLEKQSVVSFIPILIVLVSMGTSLSLLNRIKKDSSRS